ncbi:MAG: hypothetical protein J0M01_02235 [Dechloromonas sp.]|jgi:hypothetical protein|nr:hypothetical protein [Dechloromonas sp.]
MAGAKKTPALPPQEGGVQIEAIEPIRHDGIDVEPGETFIADAVSAAALVASGAARNPEAA